MAVKTKKRSRKILTIILAYVIIGYLAYGLSVNHRDFREVGCTSETVLVENRCYYLGEKESLDMVTGLLWPIVAVIAVATKLGDLAVWVTRWP